MKKFFIAILTVALTIFVTGCGSDVADSNSDASNAQTSPVAKNVPSFTATTVDGRQVTEKIFADKKITMVNIWGTFCPPCIAEMPELGEMARELPADAQIIGLICDASSENAPQVQTARDILKDANADFVNIIPDAQLMKFMESVEAVPTTIFVNGKGEVVGKAIIGADVEGYKNELEKLLKQ